MHEMALMAEIVKIISEDAKQKNFLRVEKIELDVGVLSCAMPEALELAFSVFCKMAENALLPNATLVIHREKALAKCSICMDTYEPTRKISLCPNCQIPSGQIIQGEALKIRAYEGE